MGLHDLVRRLPDSAAPIHVTTRDRDSRFDDLYTVEPDGHGKRMERRNSGHVSNWIVDTNDRIRARVVNAGPGAFAIEFDEDGDDEDWRSVFTFTARDTVWLGRLSGTENSLAAVSDVGRDKIALVRIDLDTGEETVLVHDPNLSVARWFGLRALRTTPDLLEIGNGHAEDTSRRPIAARSSWTRWQTHVLLMRGIEKFPERSDDRGNPTSGGLKRVEQALDVLFVVVDVHRGPQVAVLLADDDALILQLVHRRAGMAAEVDGHDSGPFLPGDWCAYPELAPSRFLDQPGGQLLIRASMLCRPIRRMNRAERLCTQHPRKFGLPYSKRCAS